MERWYLAQQTGESNTSSWRQQMRKNDLSYITGSPSSHRQAPQNWWKQVLLWMGLKEDQIKPSFRSGQCSRRLQIYFLKRMTQDHLDVKHQVQLKERHRDRESDRQFTSKCSKFQPPSHVRRRTLVTSPMPSRQIRDAFSGESRHQTRNSQRHWLLRKWPSLTVLQ